jgi:hypothetical protein
VALTSVSANNVQGSGNSTAVSATFAQAPVSGNLLIAVLATNLKNSTPAISVAPSGWTQVPTNGDVSSASNTRQYMYYRQADGTETSVAFTLSAIAGWRLDLAEFTNSAGPSTWTLDQSAKAINGTGTNPFSTGTTAATTQAAEVVVAALSHINTDVFSSILGTYTILNEGQSGSTLGNSSRLLFAYLMTAATGTQEFHANSSNSRAGVGQIATFYATVSTTPKSGTDSGSGSEASGKIVALVEPGTGSEVSDRGKIENLIDTFDTVLDKTGKWFGSSVDAVWDSGNGGQVKLPSISAYSALATSGVGDARGIYVLTGSSAYGKFTPPALGTGTRELIFEILRAGVNNDKVSLFYSGGSLYWRRVIGGTTSLQNSVTYDPVNHAWWRIRESGGIVYFDTSADASTWTNRDSFAPGFNTDRVWISVTSGYYGTESAANAFVDNFNFAAQLVSVVDSGGGSEISSLQAQVPVVEGAASGTVGNLGVETNDDSQAVDLAQVCSASAGVGGKITSAFGYISGQSFGTGNQQIRVVVYADITGEPGALLGYSDIVTVVDGQAYGWVQFPFSSNVVLTPGSSIWIGYHGGTNTDTIQMRFGTTPNASRFHNDTFSDGPVDPWGGSISAFDGPYSLYAVVGVANGVDSSSLVTRSSISATDSGSGSEISTTAAVLAGTTDTGSGTDASTLVFSTSRVDSGAGSEVSTPTAQIPVSEIAVDAQTVLLIHADGADASTSFTDASSYAHPITANGNAQVDVQAPSLSFNQSAQFDGASSLSTPDSTDFEFGSSDFTLDCWVRFASVAADQLFIAHFGPNPNFSWYWAWMATNNMRFTWSTDGTSFTDFLSSWTPSINTWYHVAITRNGNTLRAFVNGTQIGTTTTTDSFFNIANALYIGRRETGSQPLNGWLDEIRISKGVARWTSSFTAPLAPYSIAGVNGVDTATVTAGVTPISVTDSGSGSEISTLVAVASATTDTGAGSEVSSETFSCPVVDSGTGADASGKAVLTSDTGSGSEISSIAPVLYSTTDVGAGLDASNLFTGSAFSVTDSGIGSEVSTLTAVLSTTESGAGSEISSKGVATIESGAGTEISILAASTPVVDTGSGTEASGKAVVGADAGAGSEISSEVASCAVVDSGAGVDVSTVSGATFFSRIDSGLGVDISTVWKSASLGATYGVSPGYDIVLQNPARLNTNLSKIAEVGATAVRLDSNAGIQTEIDNVVAKAAAYGLKSMLIIYANFSGPEVPPPIGTFAAQQATKWLGDPRILGFEICNEPDLNGWSANDYADFVAAVSDVIKAIDPTRLIIAGALWKGPSQTLGNPQDPKAFATALCTRAAHKFDIFSFHGYDDPLERGDWNIWEWILEWGGAGYCDNGANGGTVRKTLNDLGHGYIPIISSENGMPETSYTEADAATGIGNQIDQATNGHVQSVWVYQMTDDDPNGSGMLEMFTDTTYREKPSYQAMEDHIPGGNQFESGAGTEISTLVAVYARTDTGVGNEISSRAASVVDSGSGSDVAAKAVSATETGIGTEVSSLAAVLAPTDTGSGVEVSLHAIPVSDSGSGSEISIFASTPYAVVDSGVGIENSTLFAGGQVSTFDAGVGGEISTARAVLAPVDVGTALDVTSSRAIPVSDSATGSDASLFDAGAIKNVVDSGTGSEISAMQSPFGVVESATGTDTAFITILFTAVDTGSGVEYSQYGIAISVVDGNTESEIASLIARLAAVDVGAGDDLSSLHTTGIILYGEDYSTGIEIAALHALFAASDGGIGSDRSVLLGDYYIPLWSDTILVSTKKPPGRLVQSMARDQ